MIDTALVDKKVAFIETCVRELVELVRLEVLDSDIREQRFAQHTLQMAAKRPGRQLAYRLGAATR
jgi:hypothetical protein